MDGKSSSAHGVGMETVACDHHSRARFKDEAVAFHLPVPLSVIEIIEYSLSVDHHSLKKRNIKSKLW